MRTPHGFDCRARFVDGERSEQVVEVKLQIDRLTAYAYGLKLPDQRLFDFAEPFGQEQWIEIGRVWRDSKPSQSHPNRWSFEVDGRFFEDGLPRKGTQKSLSAATNETVTAAKPLLFRLRFPPDRMYGIPRLLARLRDRDPCTKQWVNQALAEGRHAVILALVDALADDPQRRKNAISALIIALGCDDSYFRYSTSPMLASIATEAVDVVSALIDSLEHGSSDIQHSVAVALGLVSNASDDVIPTLLGAARAENPALRAHAALGLGQVRPATADVVSMLIEGLADEDRGVRSSAAESLKNIGTDAKEAIPALIASARDADVGFLREAIEALGSFGADAKDAVNLLIEALDDKEVDVAAAEALRRVGQGAKDAEQALIKALDHEDPLIRIHIADLLRSLDADVPDLDVTCDLIDI